MVQNTVNYNVPALEKGLDILEELSSAHNPMSMSELSREIGRTSSEIYRMINCLEKRKYIVKDEGTGNYQLSLKLFELAHNHSPVDNLLRASSKPMWELAKSIRESCHLSILSHGQLTVIAQEESPEKIRFSVEIGGYFSAINNVSGRLLLAHLESDKLKIFLNQSDEYQKMSKAEKDTFIEKLKVIKEEGNLYMDIGLLESIKDISILVGNPEKGYVAALTVPYLLTKDLSNEKDEELKRALKLCADKINKALGLL